MTNNWNDIKISSPKESGYYHIIARFELTNPTEHPYIVVRDGDTIICQDYYDSSEEDWKGYPQDIPEDIDNDGTGWKIVAWKPIELPILPYEYKDAVLFKDLPVRECYEQEASLKGIDQTHVVDFISKRGKAHV